MAKSIDFHYFRSHPRVLLGNPSFCSNFKPPDPSFPILLFFQSSSRSLSTLRTLKLGVVSSDELSFNRHTFPFLKSEDANYWAGMEAQVFWNYDSNFRTYSKKTHVQLLANMTIFFPSHFLHNLHLNTSHPLRLYSNYRHSLKSFFILSWVEVNSSSGPLCHIGFAFAGGENAFLIFTCFTVPHILPVFHHSGSDAKAVFAFWKSKGKISQYQCARVKHNGPRGRICPWCSSRDKVQPRAACHVLTFSMILSIWRFCVSISLPMSRAMWRRFPMIPLTCSRFSSISFSRASFVTLRAK